MHPCETIGCVSLLYSSISGNSGDCQRARGMDSSNDASIPKKPLFPAVRPEILQPQCYWRGATVANYMYEDSRIDDANSVYQC